MGCPVEGRYPTPVVVTGAVVPVAAGEAASGVVVVQAFAAVGGTAT